MQKKFMKQVGEMFDRYSGKEELNQEIETLQSRILEMEIDLRRLEKYERKLKVAVNDRQIVEEKLKAAHKKIETLEHELEKRRKTEDEGISISQIELVNFRRIQDIFGELSTLVGDKDQFITLIIPPDMGVKSFPQYRDIELLTDAKTLNIVSKIKTETGLILFYDRPGIIREIFLPPIPVIEPKFVVAEKFSTAGTEIPGENLQTLVVAAHAGESLLMVASADKEEKSRLVRSSVKSKHGKGGFSQRRFERLRDEDIVHHAEKVRQSLIEIAEETENIDYIILCGDILLAKEIIKGVNIPVSPIIRKIDAKIDPKDPGKLLKELFAYRRYRL
ncbi:Vms1/Ankzf1 family peptidyl-tRNA hydrolase [Methanohalophilus sp.]|uniref:Vms1/Ankzf1 family peptidyl-tRNA hydrolase n=1 Tax=Methanohalophilus sp. TaxID=1966352 RepID=UPI0026236C3B|nr:Vms1/Ankzf1 family peptidyl-tRNA hydrolase [Methanohalophilus sp.]MDK2893178.1 hypothetical protein [Methanohalophilus sp.]